MTQDYYCPLSPRAVDLTPGFDSKQTLSQTLGLGIDCCET